MKTIVVKWALILGIVSCVLNAKDVTAAIDKSKSSISYQLTHPLHEVTATSHDIESTLNLDQETKTIKSVTTTIDVTTFDSGNSNRDSHAMEVIDAITYPDVHFTSTTVTPKGDSVDVEGLLTFHGVTDTVSIAASVQWNHSDVTVDGHFNVSLTAFKIERPSLLLIPVDDTLRFSLHCVYRVQ